MIAIPLQFHIFLDFSMILSYNKDNKGKPLDGLPKNSYMNNRIFGEGRLFFMVFTISNKISNSIIWNM